MGRHASLINTSPGYEELHFAAMGFEPVRNRENILNISINEKHVN